MIGCDHSMVWMKFIFFSSQEPMTALMMAERQRVIDAYRKGKRDRNGGVTGVRALKDTIDLWEIHRRWRKRVKCILSRRLSSQFVASIPSIPSTSFYLWPSLVSLSHVGDRRGRSFPTTSFSQFIVNSLLLDCYNCWPSEWINVRVMHHPFLFIHVVQRYTANAYLS